MLPLLVVPMLLLSAVAAQDPRPASAPRDEREAWFDPDLAAQCGRAADRGLVWLANQQREPGCWTGIVGHKQQDNYQELPQSMPVSAQERGGHGHLGVTALCGMAFLAGGHLPDRGTHRGVIEKAHDYVIRCGQENGFLTDAGTRMYSHAFATLFLAEMQGMAATDRSKTALESALNLICDSQNQHGGWRYNPFDRETDLSVTVCQVQALRAARNIGMRVPSETIDRAIDYVRRSRVESGSDEGLFYYKIHGRGAYDKSTEYAINAAALTALSSAGIHDEDLVEPVLKFLEEDYPRVASPRYREHFYFWYGNYYAAQAFYQHGGSRCRAFFARLAKDLLATQQNDGRWHNSVGPGDAFSTAVACILLQMPKQYLPIFQR